MTLDGETMRSSGDYLRHSALVVWMSNDDMALVRGGSEGGAASSISSDHNFIRSTGRPCATTNARCGPGTSS